MKAKEYGIGRSQGFADPNESCVRLHMNDFREGDAVYHFYGLSELFVIGANRSMNVNCVVCGSENPKSADTCHACGHTLCCTRLSRIPHLQVKELRHESGYCFRPTRP